MSSLKYMGLRICKTPNDLNSSTAINTRLYKHVEEYRHPGKLYNRFNYSDYTEYNSRNNRVWENECERAGGQQLKNTFTLLSDSIPRSLTPFLNLARLMEPEIFDEENLGISIKNPTNAFCKAELVEKNLIDPNETPLSRFCRYSNITVEKIVGSMRLLNRSPDDFFNILTNVKSGGILLAIEHVMHEKKRMLVNSNDFFTPRLISQKNLALRMLQAGSKKHTVINVTKLSHSAVDLLCKQFNAHIQTISDRLQASEPLGYENSIQDTVKSRFAIFIISLYLICMRVVLNQKARFHPLSLDGIPEEISYTLLTGCYLCAREVYTSMHYSEWSSAYFLEFFPNFNDMSELLKSVLHENTKLVACAHCHTPYFSFENIQSRKTNAFKYRSNKITPPGCPCCDAKCEYVLGSIS